MNNIYMHIVISYINLKKLKKDSMKLKKKLLKAKRFKSKCFKYGYMEKSYYNFYAPIIGLIDGQIERLNKELKFSYEIDKINSEINTLNNYKLYLINRLKNNPYCKLDNIFKTDKTYNNIYLLYENNKTQLDLITKMNFVSNYNLGYENYHKAEKVLGLFNKLERKIK